jgi:hypothetical protein
MRFKYSFHVCFLLLIGLVSQAAAQETKLKWFGHAAFSITTPKAMGNEIQIADGEVTVAMTPAVHSSSVFNPKPHTSKTWRQSERPTQSTQH